jgi:hypothetical protein
MQTGDEVGSTVLELGSIRREEEIAVRDESDRAADGSSFVDGETKFDEVADPHRGDCVRDLVGVDRSIDHEQSQERLEGARAPKTAEQDGSIASPSHDVPGRGEHVLEAGRREWRTQQELTKGVDRRRFDPRWVGGSVRE